MYVRKSCSFVRLLVGICFGIVIGMRYNAHNIFVIHEHMMCGKFVLVFISLEFRTRSRFQLFFLHSYLNSVPFSLCTKNVSYTENCCFYFSTLDGCIANSFAVVNHICSSLKHVCDANYDTQASKIP